MTQAGKRAKTRDVPSSAVAPHGARKSARSRATKAQPRARTKAGPRTVSRLTRAVISDINAELEQGATFHGAAAAAGVPRRTFFDWLARGRNGSGSALERKLAEVVELAFDRVDGEGAKRLWLDDDWRAVAWFLERRSPDRWGPPERRVQHGGAIGLYAAITPERLREALVAGEISDGDVETFARVWRVLSGRQVGGEIIEGEALEIEAGEAA
jgi:hypothetical protein